MMIAKREEEGMLAPRREKRALRSVSHLHQRFHQVEKLNATLRSTAVDAMVYAEHAYYGCVIDKAYLYVLSL